MAKTIRKWIELDYATTGSLRAEDIPYDVTQDVKTKIDSIITGHQNNWTATVDPTATDDSAAGYSAGSKRYNVSSTPKNVFMCVDASVWAAVRVDISNVDPEDLGDYAFADQWREFLTLTGTDITNKYIDLAQVPLNAYVSLTIKQAPWQFVGDDFEIITNGSDIRRLSWNGLGLDGILEAGDKLTVEYRYATS